MLTPFMFNESRNNPTHRIESIRYVLDLTTIFDTIIAEKASMLHNIIYLMSTRYMWMDKTDVRLTKL